jgi:hypothetical protein
MNDTMDDNLRKNDVITKDEFKGFWNYIMVTCGFDLVFSDNNRSCCIIHELTTIQDNTEPGL